MGRMRVGTQVSATVVSGSFFVTAFPPALLALADGTVFHGKSIGAAGSTTGEVVFNTSMAGYQEILTDPGYCKQIVMFTYPHIGNTGVNDEDMESARVQAAGLIIRDLPILPCNFRMTQKLDDWLRAENVVAIAGIDTRKLTRLLREKGAQAGCIVTGELGVKLDSEAAIAAARAFSGLTGMDLAKTVTTSKSFEWTESEWRLGEGFGKQDSPRWHVVAFDFGVKRNFLRMLASRGCRLTVVPAATSAGEVLAMKPDGVFLSNGPGDPEPCDYAVAAIREIVAAKVPTFGISLGHQLLALASGAKTMKMKFGHHGANHPVKDLETGQVLITGQSNGFSVDPAAVPDNLRVTHVSLFDGSIQGIARTDAPAFSFQGYPESTSGPPNMTHLFDRFINLLANR
jgi:carbamoyl-phosphate synthase small subunit